MEGPSSQIKISASNFVVQNAGKLRDFYRIGKMLGSGAFGEVRMCVHRVSGAQRAVKVLRKSHMDEDEMKMLFNEISILSGLDHPNIVKVYEQGELDGQRYIIMEYFHGRPMHLALEGRDVATKLGCLRSVASALEYAHGAGVIHRDVKHSNVAVNE